MKKCQLCRNEFVSQSPRQKYCGSKMAQIGCSYKMQKIKAAERSLRQQERAREVVHECRVCGVDMIRKIDSMGRSRPTCPQGHGTTNGFCRKRFTVLNRDNFTCQYCGRCAPEVRLHVDHIHPKSKGGDNSLENLITACEDCNMGKADIPLTQ